MKNLDWGKLSFGYSKTDYNVRVIIRTVNGVLLKSATLKC